MVRLVVILNAEQTAELDAQRSRTGQTRSAYVRTLLLAGSQASASQQTKTVRQIEVEAARAAKEAERAERRGAAEATELAKQVIRDVKAAQKVAAEKRRAILDKAQHAVDLATARVSARATELKKHQEQMKHNAETQRGIEPEDLATHEAMQRAVVDAMRNLHRALTIQTTLPALAEILPWKARTKAQLRLDELEREIPATIARQADLQESWAVQVPRP